MTGRAVCLVLALCLALTAAHTPGTDRRSLSRLVGQQPLLFGRRGINPNMNSLFFGKRSPLPLPPSMDDLSSACTVLLNTYRQMVMRADSDS